MNKPHWEFLHDGWFSDFFEMHYCKKEFVNLLKRHPDDNIGEIFRDLISTIDKKLYQLQKEYKKIYGVYFKISAIKKEMEDSNDRL